MNTQTFAQAQDFTALTDEELMAVNGGGAGVTWGGAGLAAFNGGPIFVVWGQKQYERYNRLRSCSTFKRK